MKLISAHIENFGRLHNFDIDFNPGCNSINGHNGWGKSTLAAFIRVMLYGFEGENKRSAPENERKRWQPWQGGAFGGSLVFAEAEKTYLVRRSFGNKASEDSFELFDNNTKIKSEDYSQRLGEELFGINSESYMRTAYIGQGDVITSTTDGINSKIGNIADSTNDLDSYEKASERLTELINKNSPRRSTGALYKLKNEVTALQTTVRDGSVILDSIHRLQDSIATKQEELGAIRKKRGLISERQKKLSEYKDVQTILDIHKRISRDLQERAENEKALRAVFPKELPNESDIYESVKSLNRATMLKETGKEQEFTADEDSAYNKLARVYGKNTWDITEHISFVKKWRDREETALREADRQADFKILQSRLENAKSEIKRIPTGAFVGIGMIVFAMVAAVLALVLLPSVKLIWTGIIISALMLTIGIVITLLMFDRHNKESRGNLDRITAEIEALEAEISGYIRKRSEIDKAVTSYLAKYGIPFSQSTATQELMNVQRDVSDFDRLKRKQEECRQKKEEEKELLNSVSSYIKGLGFEASVDMEEQLNAMLKDLNALSESRKLLRAAQNQLKDYEEEHNIEKLKQIKPVDEELSLGELTEELVASDREIEEIQSTLRTYNNQQNIMQEKLDTWEENRELLSEKERRLYEDEKQYKQVQLASKYLTLAKEAMTAKYMEPLLKGFKKYYGAVTGKEAAEYVIDANTNISVDVAGRMRDIRLLSTGYQDLIGFCMRLSLADAMYQDEKPVLILDDPFVNFDREKRLAAEGLLKFIEKDYQLIYFTCH